VPALQMQSPEFKAQSHKKKSLIVCLQALPLDKNGENSFQ
jgi:hypothetical protein